MHFYKGLRFGDLRNWSPCKLIGFWNSKAMSLPFCWFITLAKTASLYSFVLARKNHRALELIYQNIYSHICVISNIYENISLYFWTSHFQELWRVLLRTNKWTCCSLMNDGRKHETLGSEPKVNLLLTEIAVARVSINIPEVPIPTNYPKIYRWHTYI